MALGHSPKIVTDGLVFYYDMENSQKSWKGKPTTNITRNVNLYSVSGSARIEQNTIDVLSPINTKDVAKVFRGTSAAYQTINESLVLSAGTYTVSWYGKENPSNKGQWFVQFNDGTWKNSIYNLANHPYNSSTQKTTYIKDDWYRFEWIVTTVGGTVSFTFHPFAYNQSAGDNLTTFQYFWGLQMELQPFATPYVAGTRSNTQALLDLTGQNTITANSLTYNSDGSFQPNTTDSLDIGPSSNYFPSGDVSHNLSVEMIVYPTSNNKIFFGQFIDQNRLYIGIYSDNTIRFGFGAQSWGVAYPGGTLKTVSLNKYCHVCLSIINGTAKLYVNGEESVYYTDTAVTLPSKLNFGVYYENGTINSSYLSGYRIPLAKLYNRGLTASEVQQNFNATRSRYGV